MMQTTTKSIPFFNYPAVFNEDKDNYMRIFQDVCERGAYILQKDLGNFEKNLAKFANVKYAIGVANGTDAIFIVLEAAGIGAGDEVIFASHTFVATAGAIHIVGATPVPIECGYDHMMDPSDIERAITPRTKAIVPTQLNGRCCNMDAIQAIADKYKLIIIEDAAQALGAKFKGRQAGTFGLAGTISFYPAKTLGSFGDSGAILTNDDKLYEIMVEIRDHGRSKSGDIVRWGYNSRLDNLQAALLDHKLTSYESTLQKRRELASYYQSKLGHLSHLKLPVAPDAESDHYDIYQNYEIEAENRDALKQFLADNGIGTLIQWGGKLVHEFKNLNLPANLPYSEQMMRKSLLLPLHPYLSLEDIDYISQTIIRFYN